jgi:two-component SAPR family response regulator
LGAYNGLDLLQDIRNTYNQLPVILCTGYPGFRNDLKSIAADHYVVKSSDLSELKSKIDMIIGGTSSLSEAVCNDMNLSDPLPRDQIFMRYRHIRKVN